MARLFERRLHPINEHEFFQRVKLNESYTYAFSHYLFSCVKRIAKKNGFTIIYNPPGSPEYKELGDASFKVIGTPQTIINNEPQIFDPKNLVNEVNYKWLNIET